MTETIGSLSVPVILLQGFQKYSSALKMTFSWEEIMYSLQIISITTKEYV